MISRYVPSGGIELNKCTQTACVQLDTTVGQYKAFFFSPSHLYDSHDSTGEPQTERTQDTTPLSSHNYFSSSSSPSLPPTTPPHPFPSQCSPPHRTDRNLECMQCLRMRINIYTHKNAAKWLVRITINSLRRLLWRLIDPVPECDSQHAA